MNSLPTSPFSSPDFVAIFVRNCVIYAVMAFHVYEWLHLLPFELRCIWRKPSTSIVKWQYLFSLYGGAVMQAANGIVSTYLQHRMQTMKGVPTYLCYNWHISQWVSGVSLMLCLQISLLHRTFALYHGNCRLGSFLVALVTAEYLSSTFWGITIMKQTKIDGPCLIGEMPKVIAYTSAVHLTAHVINWVLTFLKFWRGKARLLSLVMRDHSIVFGAMLGVFVAIIVNTVRPDSSVHKSHVFQAVYPIMLLLFTSTNCHIIKSMEGMHDDIPEVELTSYIGTQNWPSARQTE